MPSSWDIVDAVVNIKTTALIFQDIRDSDHGLGTQI